MSYSCSDFTDDILNDLARAGFICKGTIENDDPLQQAEMAGEAIRVMGERIAKMEAALRAVLDAWSFISEGPQPEPMRHAIHKARAALQVQS